ncbi:MAG: hypothetical protein PHS32_04915 [Rhodoferax sp.]|uniref:hypothetical protein n=1 Tax=Rhodoferax sp. TaxID=50421 RepID=UPI00261B01B0|nr:hypothetical protein [Rhodoferax sp.]MDD5333069.1 hypothetical protein [Rhodoferax sp.]
MSLVRLVTYFILFSLFAGGVVQAQDHNLEKVAGLTSALGYSLGLTQEEKLLGVFSCEEKNLPATFDDSPPAGKTVCDGTIHDSRIHIFVGWKSVDYKKVDASRDIGNKILAFNKMKAGKLYCDEEDSFPKKLGKIDTVVANCNLVAENGPTFWISILFLYSKSTLGTSQTIATLSMLDPRQSDKESVRQELGWLVQRIQ